MLLAIAANLGCTQPLRCKPIDTNNPAPAACKDAAIILSMEQSGDEGELIEAGLLNRNSSARMMPVLYTNVKRRQNARTRRTCTALLICS